MDKFPIVAVDRSASDNSSKRSAKTTAQNSSEKNLQKELVPQIALHVFRPPVPARVRLDGNKPVFASFQGCSGKVVHASGPWRTSGHWWEEKPWQEDIWDLEIQFSPKSSTTHGFYRFSYDGLGDKWFVRGVYD
jgi:hypothetical protein